MLSYDGVGNVKIEFMWCVMARTGMEIQTLGTYQQDSPSVFKVKCIFQMILDLFITNYWMRY